MKSKQVLSVVQMKHLEELGLDTSDASMHWQFLPTVESFFNAYTLQDILDKLPRSLNPFPSKQILFSWTIEGKIISYRNIEGMEVFVSNILLMIY